jgi:hypothetical protein
VSREKFECVVIVRLPNGDVWPMMQDDEKMALFASVDEVDNIAKTHLLLRAFPYQIVELDEI